MSKRSRGENWDWPVKLVHWGLAIGVLVSWYSATRMDDGMTIHYYSGYSILSLLLFRLIWGFVGPSRARFSSFVYGPTAVWRHARSLLSRQPASYPSHSPLGGWMVLLLLVLVACQAGAGLMTSDEFFFQGPLAAHVPSSWVDIASSWHHTVVEILWVALGIHVGAAFFYLLWKRQNLITPLMSPAIKGTGDTPHGRAVVLLLTCAGAVFLTTWLLR